MKNKKIIVRLFLLSFIFIGIGLFFHYRDNIFHTTLTNSRKNYNEQSTGASNYGKIHFMNTGSSDCIIIESNGHFGLVDSSNPYKDGTAYSVDNATESVQHVKNYLNKLGVSKLDFVVGTHSHSDHIGGIPVIANSFVDSNTKYYYRKYTTTLEDTTKDWDNEGYYNRAVDAMKSHGAQLVEVTNKEPTFSLGGFTIKLINTEVASNDEKTNGVVIGENKNSIVTYITYNGKSKTLLAADMEVQDEMKVANKVGKIEILKIGHHSYDTSTKIEFAKTIKPQNIIVTNSSVVDGNTIGTLSYSQTRNNTSIYVTGKATDAIVATYSDSSYTISPSDSKISNFTVTDKSGGWEKVHGKYWLYYESNIPVYNDWREINSHWYFFNNMGVMVKSWQEIEGKWYYFNPSTTDDLPEGAMIKGWKESNNLWYYLGSDGAMVTGWQKIGGQWYYFNSKGAMVTGWQELTYEGKKNWYYFDSDGKMITGWKQSKELWYYLTETATSTYPVGAMVANTCMKIDGKNYCFNSDGAWDESITGFATVPTTSYCQKLTYNGSNQTLTKTSGSGYTFSNNTGKNAGKYTVTATLKTGYLWSDGTSSKKTFTCSIEKKNPTISGISNISVNVSSSKNISLSSNYNGTFKISSNNSNITFTPSSVSVAANKNSTIKVNGAKKGTSIVTVKFVPSDTTNISEITKTFTVNVQDSSQPVNNTIKLTVNPNGGVWNGNQSNTTSNHNKGDVVEISNPTRNGYTFKGWDINNNSTISGNKLTLGTTDTVIKAKWERNVYTVSYHANGGEGSMEETTSNSSGSAKLSKCTFTREGYRFVGWSKSSTGSIAYNDEDTIQDTSGVDSILLYAKWVEDSSEPVTYTIKFDSNGGEGSMSDFVAYDNQEITLRENLFEKEGYLFKGWSLEKDGEVKYLDQETVQDITSEEDITLYAVWERIVDDNDTITDDESNTHSNETNNNNNNNNNQQNSNNDMVIYNVPNTMENSTKLGIVLSIIFFISGFVIIKKVFRNHNHSFTK